MSDDGRRRVGKLHRMSEPGKQIRIPCRYCSDLTDFSEDLLIRLAKWSRETIERRGEHPIRRDEIAVCPACRPRYRAEFFPGVHYIEPDPEAVEASDWGQEEAF